MAWLHYLHTHFFRPPLHAVKVLHFKPQQYTVPIRPVTAISDAPVMMLRFEAVQLQDKLTVQHQLFIRCATVAAP